MSVPVAMIAAVAENGVIGAGGAIPWRLSSDFAFFKRTTVGKPLIMGRKSVGGSLIGGIKETQEMLDYCGEHGIVSDVEIIPVQKINEAYERMLKSDVRYRFSIDLKSMTA